MICDLKKKKRKKVFSKIESDIVLDKPRLPKKKNLHFYFWACKLC